ncbi:MAG: HAMP domain-containing histidine kinase [Actinomycetia bacterium]|nr:HAMP domain-containing histidine kinase [Actinomycetes bacterium]
MSLRQRLTRQAAWAVVSLVLGFGCVTWVATALHLYAVTRAQAAAAAHEILDHVRDHDGHVEIPHYRYPEDPGVWIREGGRLVRTANVAGRPVPAPGLHGLGTPDPAVVVRAAAGDTVVTVAAPLAADLDVLRDLLVVLGLLGVLSGAVGWWLARWATGRMLVPVDRMTRAVGRMVRHRTVTKLPVWSDTDDEFNRLSQVFNALLAELEGQAERERQMLTEVAHEFRTPLQVLQGNLDLLADWGGQDPAVRAESLEQSRQVLARLARLVGDILTLERARTGRPGAVEAIDLAAVVEGMVDDVRALAPGRTVAAEAAPATVWATRWMVERALWAVADNAIKYTPAGGTIRLGVVTRPGRAGIAVADTGPGIPPEERAHVFDRFFRGRTGRERGGSGLGLALARALVEYDGGAVELESEEGCGTTVTLWWPVTAPGPG